LDPKAIEEFRKRWINKSGNSTLANLPAEQFLRDAEAMINDGITYAALIVFGKREALSRYLGQTEVVFEYRSSDASGPASQRKEYREGFFSFYDDLWQTINLRNDLQHYQDGLFILDIPTFAERPVREAVLNAVSHRDYQLSGSIFVRQYPQRLVIESPGGFPIGITLENILDRQSPRNRRIADIFARCGLVERSGQGMNLIFEQSIREGKPLPDFTGTDRYQVKLTLHGQIRDPRFVQFLERVGQEKLRSYGTEDFLILDLVHREQPVPLHLESRLRALTEDGVIETIGRGRGVKRILSRRFYRMAGRKGVYTRKKGLDRETNKQLLLKHIIENKNEGSKLAELMQVLPALSKYQVQTLLRELKAEKRTYSIGATNAGRWYPGQPS
jgi:ATP-dependent DNA helicase RecG